MSDIEQFAITQLYYKECKASEDSVTSSDEMREILTVVFEALVEKGFEPYRQISGYIISDDPAYIPDYKNARSILGKIDRDTLLNELVKCYFEGISKAQSATEAGE